MQNKWTQRETDWLLALMKIHGRDFKTIGRIMCRSDRSCDHRWRWLNISKEQRERRNKQESLRKAVDRDQYVGVRKKGENVRPVVAPPEIFEERARRLSAPRTIGQIILGDPPPGYSALDLKRRGEQEPVYIDKRLAQFQRAPSLAGVEA